ncbi:MAG: hypothetical protein ACM3N9_00210, partial [Syntrophothermus sp.]
LLLVLMSAAYLWQHFYGEKWVKQYAENLIARESDSLYSLKIGDLSINLIAGRVTITDAELIPDTNVYKRLKAKGHVPPFLVHAKFTSLKIRGFETARAIREKEVSVSRILIENPEVYLVRMSLPDTIIKDTTAIKRSLSLAIPKGLNSVQLKMLKITQGKFDYTDRTISPVRHFQVPELDVEVTNFMQDKGKDYSDKIFNSDDISVTFKGLAMNTPDSNYRLSLAAISISTKSQAISIDSFRLTPLVSRAVYFKKVGYQTDQFNVLIGRINLANIYYPGILLNNYFHSSHVLVEGMNIQVYRDKRVPRRPNFKPKMPQAAIRSLKARIIVDSITLVKGYAQYEEQVGDEPGKIFFDQISGKITNFTSDSTLWRTRIMEIDGKAMLMGKGLLKAHVYMPIYPKNNAFVFSGTVNPFDLTAVNPMLTKLAPAKIIAGRCDQITINPVKANDDFSQGTMEFLYSDLNVEMEKKDEKTWTSIKTGALNIAANTFVVNSNPKNGNLKTGIIYFNRDKSKGIINFLWKSVFSGIKSTVGINTKDQKEIKKERKQERREEKKQEKKNKKNT